MTAPDWDDLTLEMPVAGRKPDPLPEPGPEMHGPRVRRLLFAGIAVAVAVIGVLIIVSINRAAPGGPRRAAATSGAAIDVIGGTTITVRTADLGEDRYRVRPEARVSDDHGRIRLEVPGGPVELLLAAGVAWDLGVHGAAESRTVDLAQARVSTVALYDGATRLDLRLPRPDGTLAVRLTGGVNQFALHTTDGAPVRVRVGSGAGRVVLPGQSHDGVAPGALFTPAGWSGAGNRVDLDAAAGLAQLTVSPG